MASGIQLPERASRGKRMGQVMEDEEGDVEFWNQEFFAEEVQDIDYQESSEEEDVPDSDFEQSVRARGNGRRCHGQPAKRLYTRYVRLCWA